MRRRLDLLGIATVALVAASPLFQAGESTRVHAQQSPITPVVVPAAAVGESVALRDLPPDQVYKEGDPIPPQPIKTITPPRIVRFPTTDSSTGDGALSGPSQGGPVPLAIPTPALSFEGLSFQDNINAGFGQLSPPDTNGDVGPNHYVQQTNLLVRVWDKAGNPLTAPFKLSSLFAPIGGQCAAPDAGDPIVLYDPLADRWILSQFAFASTSAPPYYECIAVSKTGDPTGAYWLYAFVTPGNEFPDYPKLGVWPDAYYMTTNQFLLGGNFDGAGVFAFDRAKMIVGDPTAALVYFNLNLASHPEAIGGMLPSDLDGLTPPPAGRPNTFVYFLATEFGDAIDGLRLFDFHVDWTNPANSTFTERAESPVPVAAFNPLSPSGRNDVQQPPPATNSNALDSISDRLMHRLQYRNFGAYESLVTNHTVNVTGGATTATYRAGIRYYQLVSQAGAFSVAEQATYSPDTDSRWMGSAAIDHSGNLAVGYSVSSLTTFPSIRYAGRLATDLPGGLFQGEAEIIAGSGVQRSTGGRWGDYSALTVDPADDCTFWYTTEYYTAASQAASTVGWLTRIGSFRFAECTPAPSGTLQGTVVDAATNAPIAGATIQISGGAFASTDASGAYSRTLAPGPYTVTASRFGYLPATATVTIDVGATTVQDFALTPLPVVQAAGSALSAEGFSPPNGALDPGEQVTVEFTLANVGPGNTTNLVATLQATGGVLSPGGPQTYGVIAANGGAAARPFQFRVDPNIGCGSVVTATLQLQDGALDLGTVTYVLQTGVEPVILTENFDGVAAPALPAGWTATVASGLSTNNWRTVTTSPDTAPNAAFVPDASTVHDVRLDSPVFAVPGAGAQLTFRNNYATEAGFDGGVLEISINGGAFTDILAAGGSFVSGGYNRTLSTGFSNPLPGRQAWSGNSNGYITTTVNLPAAAAGTNVQLRWRMGSDSSVGSTGWRVDTIRVTGGAVCAFTIVGDNATITAESFSPVNGAIDPGELVTVAFRLRNNGSLPTQNLEATLLETGGVLNPTGPETYGVIAAGGGTGTRSFTFRADPLLPCGGQLTATLHLQDGSTDLGTVSFTFTLGTNPAALAENFDGVVAPALPAGWTATVASGLSTNNWRTVTTSPDTAPNAAFVPDPSTVHDVWLDTPVFAVPGTGAQLTFRNYYATESGFDGGVLEISIDGGAFTDILAAGGSFVSGGYNRTLSTSFSNPLGGRQAWSGNSGGYITTTVDLPPGAAGANVQLRWRMGSDTSVSSTGWRVDTILVSGGYQCATNAPPAVTVAPASQSVQYSDPIAPVTVTGTDAALDTPLAINTQWKVNGGAFTSGLPAWLVLTDNGCAPPSGNDATCSWTLSGLALTAPGIYTVRVTVTDLTGDSTSRDVAITVTQEDARATYAGPLYVSTGSPSTGAATLTLAATVQDISVTSDAAGDTWPGDIRNASVTFVNRDAGNAVLCTAPVGLVSLLDLQTGVASCQWSANIGSADAATFTIGIVVGNYYTRNSGADNVVVTVAKPLASYAVSGGGFIVLSSSAGLKAGDPASHSNFGLTAKYNKAGTSLQGNVNVLVRRTESDGLHVYQVKGNALSSLSVQRSAGTATLISKASIQDVTIPGAPIAIEGNATLQVTMADNGEPGSSDAIGITVFNKNGGLWFSSNWSGVKTVNQQLAGGNIRVR